MKFDKKTLYIFAFTFLGVLLGFVLHMWIEIWYIKKLLLDFNRYSLGFTWADLFFWHRILSIALSVILGIFGFWSGEFWWRQIYVLKRYRSKKL